MSHSRTSPFSLDTATTLTTSNASEQAPHPRPPQRRQHLRFDQLFAVRLESALFGDAVCIARNVSEGGMFLEMGDPLPLGSAVRVCFPVPDGSGEVVAIGEVKNHYFINYVQAGVGKAVAGMAVRFTSFESDSHRILEDCLGRLRVLH
jgi:PilZ domain